MMRMLVNVCKITALTAILLEQYILFCSFLGIARNSSGRLDDETIDVHHAL